MCHAHMTSFPRAHSLAVLALKVKKLSKRQGNPPMLSHRSKTAVVFASDVAVILLCLVPALMRWKWLAKSNDLALFMGQRQNQVPLLVFILCLATLFVRLSIVTPMKCSNWKPALAPTVSEARHMKVCTALTDYFLVAALFWFWRATHTTKG